MLRVLILLPLLVLPRATAAQDLALSRLIATDGLAAAEARLAALPGAEDRFALGAVRFLRGVEKTLQLRYRSNAQLEDLGVPVLRLPIPPNPDPEPFDPALIATLFDGLRDDMEAARAALAGIPADADVALEIDVMDLWFDANVNGTRDQREGVLEIAAGVLGGGITLDQLAPVLDGQVIRFDTADAAWLAAYTHLLSGVAELVLAFDPTTVIAEVTASAAAMRAIQGPAPPDDYSFLRDEEPTVDLIAMVYGAINRRPDPGHAAAARTHLLGMIAENREFWRRVALETDDRDEWIPNRAQTAALGFALPPDTEDVWQAVLADAEAILNGELLIPHWRTDPGGGVNVRKLFENPPVVDLVTWVQGAGLLPYMEPGPLASARNLDRFEAMFLGDALLFMVLLN